MSESAQWVAQGDRARLLIPALNLFAFSPDELWLAWTSADARTVTVSEVSSGRTVTRFEGDTVAALHWASRETLRVLRRAMGDATLHVAAIPDGGEVAQVRFANVGVWAITLDASADGRTALVGHALGLGGFWLGVSRTVQRYILRGELGDEVERFDPFARSAPSGERRPSRCAMSPDGATMAVAFGPKPIDSATMSRGAPRPTDARVHILDLRTGDVTEHALHATGTPSLVEWVSPSRVLVAMLSGITSLFGVDVRGGATLLHRLEPGDLVSGRWLDLHPDRAQLVAVFMRHGVPETQRAKCFATVIPLSSPLRVAVDPPRLDLTGALGYEKIPNAGCARWGRDGRLLTLTQPLVQEAHLDRRETPTSAPRSVLHIALTGAAPHEVDLTLSPLGGWAAVTWRTRDLGDGTIVKRGALVKM